MEMTENVFLETEGMTSTEGNFLCNIAQEMIREAQERLNSVKFYKVSVSSIAGGEKQLMTVGNTSIDFILEDLNKISEMNSFCAWVREAIKSKDELIEKVSNLDFGEWAKDMNIELPKYPDKPICPPLLKEKDVLNSWDINRRNKYLKLEAFAATYGKYIHPNGAFSSARKDVHTAQNCPIYKEGSGRDLILYYQEPTISPEEVDAKFMELQGIYRSYEKELNAMKADLKTEVNKLTLERNNKYQEALAKFKSEYEAYDNNLSEIKSQFNNWKTSELETISKLKITLPDNLKSIYSEIKSKAE